MGLTAAMLGAHVTMTDLGEVIPTLRDNVERNIAEASSFASSSPSSSSSLSSSSSATRCGKVEARELDWTDDAALRRIGTETEWDLVVASDVMYSDTVFRLFFHALTTVLGLESAVGGSQPVEGEARRRRQRRRAVQVVVGHKVRCEDERAYFETVRRVFDVVPIGRAFNTRVYLWQPRHG
jgi:predicted nicotinamide N-methyase